MFPGAPNTSLMRIKMKKKLKRLIGLCMFILIIVGCPDTPGRHKDNIFWTT
jgi:hypothetical protein